MKVNSNRDISFKSFYTNNALKKGLEFAADNGALFAASATVGFSMLRPMSIWLTPKTEKENRKLAISKSLMSSVIGFILTLGLSAPLAKSIKKIDKNPEKYITKEAIEFFKGKEKDIYNSKSYSLATQIFKLGLAGVVAIPKAIMVASGMPYVLDFISSKENKQKTDTKNISFKANSNNKIASYLGKIFNKKGYQKFSDKYKDTNFPMHIVAITDIISTGAFVHQTSKSKKIDEGRKQTLINNSWIGTGLSILSGYILDNLLNKPTEKYIKNFKKANIGKPNLDKQIQGIKIAKPILILGSVYYILIPFLSTFLAERTEKNKKS